MQNRVLGKIPPQAIEAEESVLASLLSEPGSYHKISSWITAESFYKEDHKILYKAISSLHSRSKEVDIISVMHQLTKTEELEKVGGPYFLTEISMKSTSSANIEERALIIQERFLQREIITMCSSTIESAYKGTDDVFEMYDNLSSDLFNKVAVNVGKQAVIISDILSERIKVYEQPAALGLTGLSSGLKSVDDITGGWQDSDLIIIAARPGMGKTAFVLNLARNAAIKSKKATAIFSLEMSKEQIVDRMVSAETGIFFDKIRHRNLNEYDHRKIMEMTDLINSSIFIDDSAATPIQALRSKATRLKHKHDIGLIVVDYLQLMRGDKDSKGGNREQEISSISRGLKAIAKDLNIPVIALSQLSRAVESRPGALKRPMLSDLRESGSIEQDADQVIFLFRPEYYGIHEDEAGRSLTGISEVIFGKNRHGALDTAITRFNGAYMKFSDLENEYQEPPEEPITNNHSVTIQPNFDFDRSAAGAPF